jgi:rhodanese-related sulfurtransferase
MTDILEIDANIAYELLSFNPETLLVCAYENEEEFHQHDLEGAISLNEFRLREHALSKDRKIIFYCACPHDEAALKQARKYCQEGFTDVCVLQGGVNAWKDAGFPILEKV